MDHAAHLHTGRTRATGIRRFAVFTDEELRIGRAMARLPAPSGPKKLRMAHPPFPGGSREFFLHGFVADYRCEPHGWRSYEMPPWVPCNLILHLVMHSKDKDSFDEAESQSSWDKTPPYTRRNFSTLRFTRRDTMHSCRVYQRGTCAGCCLRSRHHGPLLFKTATRSAYHRHRLCPCHG